MDYTRFFSRRAVARRQNPMQAILVPLLKVPDLISLGGGMPNSSCHPLSALSFSIQGPWEDDLQLTHEELNDALQYGPSKGMPRLLAWVTAHMSTLHGKKPPATQQAPDGWSCVITAGSQDAASKTFDALLDDEDSIIIENPTYAGTLAALTPYQVRFVCVDVDADGMNVPQLRRILETWDEVVQGRKPRVVYTIPTGQNPSGTTLSLERRLMLLQLAEEHDLIIMEDDPYYYVQYSDAPSESDLKAAHEPCQGDDVTVANDATTTDSVAVATASGQPHRNDWGLVPSLWGLDTHGRVVRFDSMSKVAAAGIRIGWATGPAPIIEKIELHQQSSTLHNCGISQAIMARILIAWGDAGFRAQLHGVQSLYRHRRDSFMASCERHLKGLARWTVPTAGFFVWIEVLADIDTQVIVMEDALKDKVLLLPGRLFSPVQPLSRFLRASFSIAPPDQMDEGLRRLAVILRRRAAENSQAPT